MGVDAPAQGRNYSGDWAEGKSDAEGNVVPFAHSNARYTMRLGYLENIDPAYNDKNGVLVEGIIYGGRDSDTSVPIEESPDWESGIIVKACTLESETTSATIGKEGVLAPQPMANLDFISYPIGQYISNNVRFAEGMKRGAAYLCRKLFSEGCARAVSHAQVGQEGVAALGRTPYP